VTRQFNPIQQAHALALLEQMTWGDMDDQIRGMEEALRLALEATSSDFYRWEEEIGPPLEARGYDEFSLPDAVLQAMPTDEKLAYVARLLRSLALQYGVSAEFGGGRTGLVGEAHEVSPAALLRGLNDTLWMPTTADTVES
jgi:hypothetical protein